MINKLVHYIVKKDEIKAVKEAISIFQNQIKEHEPDTRCEIFHVKGSTAFYHIMSFKDHQSEEKHQQKVYTKEFASILYPRCIVEPKFMDIESV